MAVLIGRDNNAFIGNSINWKHFFEWAYLKILERHLLDIISHGLLIEFSIKFRILSTLQGERACIMGEGYISFEILD